MAAARGFPETTPTAVTFMAVCGERDGGRKRTENVQMYQADQGQKNVIVFIFYLHGVSDGWIFTALGEYT